MQSVFSFLMLKLLTARGFHFRKLFKSRGYKEAFHVYTVMTAMGT